MVDAICAQVDRAKHLCAVLEPGAHPAVLAVASDACNYLAYRGAGNGGDDQSPVIRGLADRVEQQFSDQSFRAVRIAAGRQQSIRPRDTDAPFPDAAVLQVR